MQLLDLPVHRLPVALLFPRCGMGESRLSAGRSHARSVHCPTCDCTTHWTATEPTQSRMGINLRMLHSASWADLPRKID